MRFNEKLKKLRSDKGLSQAELAEKIFVSRSAVAKWESGLGLPSETSLDTLAKYFSITKEELLADTETETLIVEKNITISKSKKSLIIVSAVCFIVILSLILALILMPKSNGACKYSIGQSSYQNIKQLNTFCQSIGQTLQTESDSIYMKNGGEIRADEYGQIQYVNIDVFVANDNGIYALQIQKQGVGDYTVIREPLRDIGGERVLLNDVLCAVSLWELADGEKLNFILNADMPVNIKPSDNTNRYLYENGNLNVITNKQIGLFSRTMVLTQNQDFSELYIKIKG